MVVRLGAPAQMTREMITSLHFLELQCTEFSWVATERQGFVATKPKPEMEARSELAGEIDGR